MTSDIGNRYWTELQFFKQKIWKFALAKNRMKYKNKSGQFGSICQQKIVLWEIESATRMSFRIVNAQFPCSQTDVH